jgi:hypothetical protein
MIEASMIVRKEIEGEDSGVMDRRDAWILASVEVAEITCKVLDWKIKHCSIGE